MAEQASSAQQTEEEEHQRPAEQPEHESQETPPDGGVSDSGEPETPEQPPEPESDEDQFARLMRERREQREGKTPEPEPEPERQEGEDPEGGQQPQGQQEEPDEGEQPEGEPPDTGAEDEQGKESDWFAQLPEEARQQIVQLQNYAHDLNQRYQALHGRLAPVQRQNEDLRKRLRELESAPPPTLNDLEENNAWKDIQSELPDEAGELKKVFTSQHQALQRFQDQQQQLQQALEQERQDRLATEMRRLTARHPNVHQVRSHPLFQQWRQAIEANPQAYPQIVSKLHSVYWEDTADVLDQFKTNLKEAYPDQYAALYGAESQPRQPQQQQPQSQGRRPSRPKPPNPSPPSQGSGVSGAQRQQVPMTREEAFSEYLRSKQRR